MTGLTSAARWRLTALAVLVPLAIVAALLIVQDYQARRASTITNLELKSAQINAQLEDFVNTTEGVTGLFAEVFSLHHPDLKGEFGTPTGTEVGPNSYMVDFLKQHPQYTRALVADTDGRLLASSSGFTSGAPIADRVFLEKFRGSTDFVVSDVFVPENGAEPNAMFSNPIRDESGNVGGYLVVKSELSIISGVLDMSVGFPESAKSGIFDSKGVVLAGSGYKPPHPGAAVGKDISGSAVWAQALTRPTEVWFGLGLDKVDRIIFYSYPEKTPWVTTVAFEQSELFDPLWRRVWGFTAGLAGTVLGTLLLTDLARRRERRAWTAVTRERRTLQSVVDGATDGMLVMDAEGKPTYVNKRFKDMFGLRDFPEVNGSSVGLGRLLAESASLSSEGAQKLSSLMEITDGMAADTMALARPKALEAEVVAYPIRSSERRMAGRTLIFHDVTDERRLQRLKSEFVAHASHQLRTPLASILASSELLLDAGSNPKKREKWVHLVHSQALRMRNTISTLLNLSQLESGRISLDLTNIDLSSLVNEVIRDARAQSNGHEFEVSIPSELRAVRADRAKMVEVLQNLIDNAVKYSPDGGRVTVSVTSAGVGQVTVQVSDQGVGIREEDLDSLFSPYERASAQANGFSNGTGLGLYIVRSLVEIQGGKVWAESKIGTGSTFSFTIPDARSPQETGGGGRGDESEVESQVRPDSTPQPVPAAPIVTERPGTA